MCNAEPVRTSCQSCAPVAETSHSHVAPIASGYVVTGRYPNSISAKDMSATSDFGPDHGVSPTLSTPRCQGEENLRPFAIHCVPDRASDIEHPRRVWIATVEDSGPRTLSRKQDQLRQVLGGRGLEATSASIAEENEAPAVQSALDEVPLAGERPSGAVDRPRANDRHRHAVLLEKGLFDRDLFC